MILLIGAGFNCSWDIVDIHQKNFWVNRGIPKSLTFRHWNFANGSSKVHNP